MIAVGFLGSRDEYGLMNGGASGRRLTLHGSDAKRGMAKWGGQRGRLREKPAATALDGRSARGKRDGRRR